MTCNICIIRFYIVSFLWIYSVFSVESTALYIHVMHYAVKKSSQPLFSKFSFLKVANHQFKMTNLHFKVAKSSSCRLDFVRKFWACLKTNFMTYMLSLKAYSATEGNWSKQLPCMVINLQSRVTNRKTPCYIDWNVSLSCPNSNKCAISTMERITQQ